MVKNSKVGKPGKLSQVTFPIFAVKGLGADGV